jgi:hypothetical protein
MYSLFKNHSGEAQKKFNAGAWSNLWNTLKLLQQQSRWEIFNRLLVLVVFFVLSVGAALEGIQTDTDDDDAENEKEKVHAVLL